MIPSSIVSLTQIQLKSSQMTLIELLNGHTSGRWFSTPISPNKLLKFFFSRKYTGYKSDPPPLTFNNIPVKRDIETKHLGMMLDSKLYFESHIEGINGKISKSRQGLGVMKQIKKYVSPRVLANNYFAYVRPHLDYGDLIIVHQADIKKPLIYDFKSSSALLDKMDMVQYDAARIVTGAWRGSPRKQLF